LVGVHAQEWVVFFNLFLAQLAHVVNWVETGVLGKRDGDLFESVSEGAHCVLLNTLDFVGFLRNSNGAGKFWGSTTANDEFILDHVAHNANSVMEASLGLVTDSATSTTDQNCYCLCFGALGDEDDLVGRSTE